MAHDLNFVNGKASMMYVGETPWHGYGTRLENPATAEEAIVAAGLDFTVVKTPVLYDYNGQVLQMDNRFVVKRTDTGDALGNVGKGYNVVQNREVFSFFDGIVDQDEAIYHTAGALGKGEKIWILAKLPEHLAVAGDDLIDLYVLLFTSHNGLSKIKAKFTPTRVVCNNTLTLALSGSEMEIGVPHTTNAVANLREAHKVMGIYSKLAQDLNGVFNRMAEVKMNDDQFDTYIKALLPIPEKFPQKAEESHVLLREFRETSPGASFDSAKGTVWGAYNAVTYFADHSRVATLEPEKRMRSTVFGGTSDQLKKRAFNYAMNFMN